MSRYFTPLPQGQMDAVFRDWRHAARLYVDDVYRLAPKPKWLFYAVFNINSQAISNTAFQQQNRSEINYLVKRMDLPKYTLEIENLNQYNRKTTTYTRINYDQVNITFHDDNNGVSNALWALYYSHYVADRLNSQSPYTDINPPAYLTHTYDPKSSFPFRYGLDVSSSIRPFFDSIQLVTLTKHKFTSYLLCHPRVTSWQHDSVDQSEGNGVVENNMSVAYDAVIYTTGTVSFDDPQGFGILHYDQALSPLGPSNSQYLQNAVNNIYSEDLMAQNPFNPVDLGISVVNNTRILPTLGNLQPYGYNIASPIIPNVLSRYDTFSELSTSGFQNYDFGGLPVSPQIDPTFNSPVDPGFNNGSLARREAITSEYSSFINNPSLLATAVGTSPAQPIISDVFTNELPKSTPSSVESKIFNDYNTGITKAEPPGPVNVDYFSQSDVNVGASISNNELLNNNPQFSDIPDDPFN